MTEPPCKECRYAEWRQDLEAMYCHAPELSDIGSNGKRTPVFTGALRGKSNLPQLANCGPEGRYFEPRT